MIDCTIKTNEKSLNVELPLPVHRLHKMVHEELELERYPGDIKIGEKNDEITKVELTSIDEIGKHLIPLFTNQNTVEDVCAAINVINNAHNLIQDRLKGKIISGEYIYINQMYNDIKAMIYEVAPIQETFYFPLAAKLYDDEYGGMVETNNMTLAQNEYLIREAVESYMDSDTENMVQYYESKGKEKMLSAIWGVENIGGRLYGKVEARFIEKMTTEELSEVKAWINGQNADGVGSGFESHDIGTIDGRLNISLWHYGDDYFIYNQEEMDAYIAEQSNVGITMK